ncbi:MAG TPA: cyclic nucleotide-binding domain-containing protein [Solirubrobacteraceae bacterium]
MDPDRLRSIELFSTMDDADLRRIATFATETSASEGQVLMRQGDFATDLVGIEEGTAEVRRDDKAIATLSDGDVFGEMGLVDKVKRSASVVSTSPMRLVKLTHWDVRRLPEETRRRLEDVVKERRAAEPS